MECNSSSSILLEQGIEKEKKKRVVQTCEMSSYTWQDIARLGCWVQSCWSFLERNLPQ